MWCFSSKIFGQPKPSGANAMNIRHALYRKSATLPIFGRVLILGIVLVSSLLALTADGLLSQVRVRGYYRKDGTYVRPHLRTRPDGNPYNNYSFPGNYNPNTGQITPGNPETYLRNYYNRFNTDNEVEVQGYYRKDGTYVSPYVIWGCPFHQMVSILVLVYSRNRWFQKFFR